MPPLTLSLRTMTRAFSDSETEDGTWVISIEPLGDAQGTWVVSASGPIEAKALSNLFEAAQNQGIAQPGSG
jgi:hypothetical protein